MEDQLKKWAAANREEFETFKAPDALWVQISADLPHHQKGKMVAMRPPANLRHLLTRVAATVALLMVAATLWVGYKTTTTSQEDRLLSQYPELKQAEQQYGGIIAAKLQQVTQHHDKHLISELLTDIDELEREFEGLKTDLRDGADNQQVIEAMIENYRLRIMLLERFLQEIDKKAKDDDSVNS